jgi:hypothetical protein
MCDTHDALTPYTHLSQRLHTLLVLSFQCRAQEHGHGTSMTDAICTLATLMSAGAHAHSDKHKF